MTISEAIKELGPKVKDRSLIAFCGAGISVKSGIPSAKKLVESINRKGLPFSYAMSSKTVQKNIKEFMEFHFGNKKPNTIHELLAGLDLKNYITTNYDPLLEKSIEKCFGKRSKVVTVTKDDHIWEVGTCRNSVIKMHGDVKDHDLLVLTKEHYISRLRNPKLVDGLVRVLLTTNPVLFIGYSLSDENIYDFLVQELHHIKESDNSDKYILFRGDRDNGKHDFFYRIERNTHLPRRKVYHRRFSP